MSKTVKQLLDKFDHLPDTEKREVAAEIMRRTVKMDLPHLTDEDLVMNAVESSSSAITTGSYAALVVGE